ncbi:hypothetical protein M3180_15490 [Paenibacillus camelliae]|nr:hypothetical protein [Paenibacillus camelliae]
MYNKNCNHVNGIHVNNDVKQIYETRRKSNGKDKLHFCKLVVAGIIGTKAHGDSYATAG